jgi:hypothetical protein
MHTNRIRTLLLFAGFALASCQADPNPPGDDDDTTDDDDDSTGDDDSAVAPDDDDDSAVPPDDDDDSAGDDDSADPPDSRCLPFGGPGTSPPADAADWSRDRRPVFAVPFAVGARGGCNEDHRDADGVYLDNHMWGYPPRQLSGCDVSNLWDCTTQAQDTDGDGIPDTSPWAVSQLIDQLLEKAYQVGFRRFMLWVPQGYFAYQKAGGNFHIDGYPAQLWTPLAADFVEYERPVGLTDTDIANAPVEEGCCSLEADPECPALAPQNTRWNHLLAAPLAIPNPYAQDAKCDPSLKMSCRQQEYSRDLGNWVQAKAAAGDPVEMGVYGGYHLHDPTGSDDPSDFFKPRLNYQFRYFGEPNGVQAATGGGEARDDFDANWTRPVPWSNPDHDTFYTQELCPWIEEVGLTMYGMDASKGYRWNTPQTGAPLRQYFRDRFPGLKAIGEAPPMSWDPTAGTDGAFVQFENAAYEFSPYIGLVDNYWVASPDRARFARDFEGSLTWDRATTEIWSVFNPTGKPWSLYPLPGDAHPSTQGDRCDAGPPCGEAARDYIDRGFVFSMYPRIDHRQQPVTGSYWLLAGELVNYALAAEGLQ